MVEGLSEEQNTRFDAFLKGSFKLFSKGAETIPKTLLIEKPFPFVDKEKYVKFVQEADVNQDEQIDEKEFGSLLTRVLRAFFDTMDANKDGKISLQEFADFNGFSVEDDRCK